MINDDQKIEESKQMIEKEVVSGNVLAAALDSILGIAHPMVRKKHQLDLYDLMKAGEHIANLVEGHNDKNTR